ncbi:Extracellular matrix-binding ebh, putative [Babesia ovata]|uniref:Extracellular matrix-binding ebh, putative n=1 Tax=Babesia ovata TaxID=189622 RepID=A0A2H6KFH0_9APIC|nr:Extracellular matrix-binding ebh, putative [Babesia ovata]GBE61709.1 Extracellular matrix-binding ebh, putative [Babesia ovata]
MDLKKAKEQIKLGMKTVIKDLNVLTLDDLVKGDLRTLRDNILGLNNGTLANSQLEALKQSAQKKSLDELAGKSGDKSIMKLTNELDTKFKDAIQKPLTTAVEAVDSAIQTLGGKFKTSEKLDTIDKIFGHIKDKVGEIKGSESSKTGLEGIVKKVKDLANAFVNSGGRGFRARVDGWVEGVVGNGKPLGTRDHKPGMKAVTSWLESYKEAARRGGQNEGNFKDQVKNKIMLQPQISHAIKEAQQHITAQKVNDKIVNNLTAIVSACNTFVSELDKEIMKDKLGKLADPIAQKIKHWMEGQSVWSHVNNGDADLKCAIRYTLLALCAGVKQVATEINSLGTDKFGKILDAIKPTVDDLDKQLKEATQIPKPAGAQKDSPAQAVDSKLKDVRDEVQGLEGKFTAVKHDLQKAVDDLPNAVDNFNQQAQAQIRAAAKAAIGKAAGEISTGSDPKAIKLENKMPTFNGQFSQIQSNLQPVSSHRFMSNQQPPSDSPPVRHQPQVSHNKIVPSRHLCIANLAPHIAGRTRCNF